MKRKDKKGEREEEWTVEARRTKLDRGERRKSRNKGKQRNGKEKKH